jgi:CheY-like chemotaxis protein
MNKRILVVENQEGLRGVLRTLLSGSGNTVLEAARGWQGAKALSEAARPRPSNAFLTVAMSDFFILRKACVTRFSCSSVLFESISSIIRCESRNGQEARSPR